MSGRRLITRFAAAALVAASLLTAGCVKRPKEVMSDSKTAKVLADMYIASAWLDRNNAEYPGDSARLTLREAVLKSRGVTQEQLDTTMSWYARNPKEYRELCEAVVKRIEKVQGESFPMDVMAEQTDGADLWPYPSAALLSPLSPTDGIVFNLDVDDLEPGDRLTLHARQIGTAPLNTLLGVVYDDGSRHYQSRQSRNGGVVDLIVQTDSARKVSRVFGKLTVRNRRDLPMMMDSISLTHAPMNRDLYYQIHGQRFLDKTGEKRRKRLEEKARADSLAAAAAASSVPSSEMTVSAPASDKSVSPTVIQMQAAPPSAGGARRSSASSKRM